MKERLSFRDEEVQAFIEELILKDEASEYEMELYQNWILDGFISELNYNIYLIVKVKMRKLWEKK